MVKLAVITSKGGTGKTTTTINLAHCLALSGKRVLVIDCDSQANIAMAFDKTPAKGLAELLITGEVDLTRLRPNLYLIDSGGRRLVETELHLARLTERETRLQQVLARLRGSDYVICDCPPTVNLINLNVLNFVDKIIVPVSMDFFACEGAKKTIALLEDMYRKIGRRVDILGILATFYDVRTRISRTIFSQLLEEFGEKVFATKIRINTQIKEAQLARKTVFEHAPYSNGALDYFLFAKEVISRQNGVIMQHTEEAEPWKA
ncbi:MAG: ParA family protein [bacterium]